MDLWPAVSAGAAPRAGWPFLARDLAYARTCITMRNPAKSSFMKKVAWMGSSKADLKAFPAAVVDDMGHQLLKERSRLRSAISNWPGKDCRIF
jgi:hypothetical protein